MKFPETGFREAFAAWQKKATAHWSHEVVKPVALRLRLRICLGETLINVRERGKKPFEIDRLVHGDTCAWEAFVNRFSPLIYSSVLAVFRTRSGNVNASDVEDMVQNVLIRLVKRDYHILKSYNSKKASFTTYLHLIAVSTTINFLRRSVLETVPLEENIEAISEPAGCAPSLPEIPRDLLSPRQKLILHFTFEKDMEVSEIAEFLGISSQTVRSTKHKAIKKLRSYFGVTR